VIDLFGVPNRIRTGVAAVKEGQRPKFEADVDGGGFIILLKYLNLISAVIRPCARTFVPYIFRT
jgi:hypothetical protein